MHKFSFEEYDKHAEEEQKRLELLNGTDGNGEDDLGVGDEEESDDLLLLDPKEWKVHTTFPEDAYFPLNLLQDR